MSLRPGKKSKESCNDSLALNSYLNYLIISFSHLVCNRLYSNVVDLLELKDKGMEWGDKCVSHIWVSCKSLFFSPGITQAAFSKVTVIVLVWLNLVPGLL